jgi:hypothetical protein
MAITGKKNDWLPGPRTEQVIMCRNWISVMDPAAKGPDKL